MADSKETLAATKHNTKSNYRIIDTLESKGFSWVFVDQSNPWKAGLSWSIFFFLTICVPVLSHLAFQCSTCDYNHRRPYDLIVQSSLSVLSAVSFLSLLSFSRKYGLRRFLFLDKMSYVSDEVRRGYSDQLHRAMKFFYAFVIPCFIANATYKIWWFVSGAHQIPYVYNICLSHTLACILLVGSWLYRTALFFLVCMLFKLTLSMQIFRLEDFAKVFENQGDVGLILMEHLTIRRTLRIISHRFRGFVLSTLILVTASQFASLLVTTRAGSHVNISTAGELALCSITLVSGLFICLRNAAKITHKAQSVTSLAAKWHTCATIDSFDDMGPTEETNITSETNNYLLNQTDSDDEGDDDKLENTKLVPIYRHTVSYQKRQALVTYLENNKAGITVFGFMLDRTYLHTIFALEMSLTLWLLNKTIGLS
ncbi:hypothetical protein HanRHA438_Chr15g0691591 [Helianthus annuus]|nr:hypothetical protein HanLR1_Chr15g0563821 [Helianthus annuus]KAJ0692131.1 hypothetical protein HanPI659440_Chr15g0582511 [Helianthus annuus]KAJ0692202.1 hypothetical protein HanPI659440_Chr15g0583251 [Helianthus annuus]KAJ0830104.1 hypothetical protein HanPSC8_Chr15g0651391 [Helianthus annuus]KAJ0843463.1 hypothetical protein HanRHA438_Chr15g0691591 [Helianthus annuus]